MPVLLEELILVYKLCLLLARVFSTIHLMLVIVAVIADHIPIYTHVYPNVRLFTLIWEKSHVSIEMTVARVKKISSGLRRVTTFWMQIICPLLAFVDVLPVSVNTLHCLNRPALVQCVWCMLLQRPF